MTNKKTLSERDICTQFITPALQRAGWDFATQVREEVICERLKADLGTACQRQATLTETLIESALEAA